MDEFIAKIHDVRQDRIQIQNNTFHEILTTILQCEREKIDYTALKNKMAEDAMDITANAVSTRITLNIDRLFRDSIIIENNRPVMNKNQLIFTFLDSKNKTCQYNLNKTSQDSTTAFENYMYTQEPNIQQIRKEIREQFPSAKITPWIFIHPNSIAAIQIEIHYDLEKSGIPGAVFAGGAGAVPERSKVWGTVMW
jgi:hypothetical protein